VDVAHLVHAGRESGRLSRVMHATVVEDADRAKPRSLARWMRDPFVHFLAIGLAILALYALVAPPLPRPPGTRITLTEDDLLQIRMAWSAKWLRPPTPAEMQDLVAAKVREEVLYREALAMGLEQDDVIVKRRMAQKLEFLTEDVTTLRDPTTTELARWYATNGTQFAIPGHVTFRHVYFSPDKRGAQTEEEARKALAQLSGAGASSDTSQLGDAFFDRSYYADRTPEEIAALFGTSFSKALVALPPGAWQGPIESGLGWHLVRVDAATPERVPAFSEVDREAVKTAWIDAQRAEAKRRAYEAMRAKYEVVLPGATTQ